MSHVSLVTSGKGGVGKSTFCAQTGLALARRGHRVLLIELDAGLRCLDIMCGVAETALYHIGDLVAGRCSIEDAAIKAVDEYPLYLICAPSDPDEEISAQALLEVCRKLRTYFEYVLIDTPAGIGNALKVAGQVADSAIIITCPDPVSVRDGAAASQLLFEGGQETQFLVINKVPLKGKIPGYYTDYDEIIDTVGARLLGVLPEDPALREAAATGSEVETKRTRQIFHAIAKRLEGEYVPLIIE